MAEPLRTTLPFDPTPQAPKHKTPPGACDCHAHVFGPFDRFPLQAKRGYTPGLASKYDYRRMLDRIGVARGVLVQPSVYGTDNRAMEEALAADPKRLRGVAVLEPTVSEAELDRLHALGVRAIRLSDSMVGAVSLRHLEPMATRLKPRGWHIQLMVDVTADPALVERVAHLAVPAVFDHMGSMRPEKGLGDPGFRGLLQLLAKRGCWVKLSGPYLDPKARPPYAAVTPIASALAAAAPDRCLWGTDWPHPAVASHMPDDGQLLDLIAEWVPDAASRRRILVDNPASLYQF
ncbi:MAG: amidohydrolase family protein [Proteobacteria bacterium]|nr:amidohydrolase family protein [Pseudomonadota bacterium]MBI3499461.1 amidohydrolase family protein [Pseudomonadota bacterium]